MYRHVKNWLLAILFVGLLGGGVAATAMPQTVAAECAKPILTFPVWYRGLTVSSDDCTLQSPATYPGGISAYIWTIVLNVIDIILQLIAYVSVFFIIYGGFQYLTSVGSADGTVKGRKTITNAVIGLVLSILSVAIVNFVGGAIS